MNGMRFSVEDGDVAFGLDILFEYNEHIRQVISLAPLSYRIGLSLNQFDIFKVRLVDIKEIHLIPELDVRRMPQMMTKDRIGVMKVPTDINLIIDNITTPGEILFKALNIEMKFEEDYCYQIMKCDYLRNGEEKIENITVKFNSESKHLSYVFYLFLIYTRHRKDFIEALRRYKDEA